MNWEAGGLAGRFDPPMLIDHLHLGDFPSTGVDISIGDVFAWANGGRPIVQVNKGSGITFRDGYIAAAKRPRRWWYLVSWYRVCRTLWRMPYMGPI